MANTAKPPNLLEQLPDIDISSSYPPSLMVAENDIYAEGTSPKSTPLNYIDSLSWSELLCSLPAQPYSLQLMGPVNGFFHENSQEGSMVWLPNVYPVEERTGSHPVEPSTVENPSEKFEAIGEIHSLQSNLGDLSDEKYHYNKEGKEKSENCLVPSVSKSQLDKGSIHERRRRKSHCEVERKYRSSLNRQFSRLEDTLRNHPPRERNIEVKSTLETKRATRITLLGQARDEILALREQKNVLERRLQSLRALAFPMTCKYTLCHSSA
ncbi:hypothetical protein N7540_004285 [Penicillium herquei]|nr:hypothetical protein N7540_004285 [Penicillium herquei]